MTRMIGQPATLKYMEPTVAPAVVLHSSIDVLTETAGIQGSNSPSHRGQTPCM